MSGSSEARARRALHAYLALFYAVLIVVPILHRGPFVYGWDLVGPAEGYRLLGERGFAEALGLTWARTRDYFYWAPTNSVLFSLGPALLHSVRPWPYWPQAFSFAVALASVLTTASALGQPRARLFAVLGAAPALAMLSVLGSPYVSVLLPFSLALALVFRCARSPATARRLGAELLLWACVAELTFHCYEMSKGVFLVPLCAAATLAEVPGRRRLLWAVGALAFAIGASRVGGGNVARLVGAATAAELWATAPARLLALGHDLLTDWSLSALVIVPLALLALVGMERDPRFWRLLWLGMLAPVGAMALLGPDEVRTRRLVLFLFCSVLVVALAWPRLTRTPVRRALVLGLLALGHAAALATAIRFGARPLEQRALPWTESPADFFLDLPLLRDAHRLVELVRPSRSLHVLVYGYSAYTENSTDPQALPERLLLGLGYDTFSRRVFLLDHPRCRYSCLATYDPATLPAIATGAIRPFYVHVYRSRETAHAEELLLAGSDRHPLDVGLERFSTWVVTRYAAPEIAIPSAASAAAPSGPARAGFCLSLLPGQPAVDLLEAPDRAPSAAAGAVLAPGAPFEPGAPTSALVSGEIANPSRLPRAAELEAVMDDELAVRINGRVVIASFGEKPVSSERIALRLAPGRNHFEAYYTNLAGHGFLRLDLRDEDGQALAPECR